MELLIVVTIIAVIAAVAIPSFLRSRAAANEGATIGALRTAATFQAVFKTQLEVDIYFSKMHASTYDSIIAVPAAASAYQNGNPVFRGRIAAGSTPGNDGNLWFPAGGK